MADRELCQFLEDAIDPLPDEFRPVLVARVIDDMSIDETAELLGIRPETVKTGLRRARRLLEDAVGGPHRPAVQGAPFNSQASAARTSQTRLSNALASLMAREL